MQAGDLLTTSGVDGVYPPGLPVAKVEKVERRADSAFARITCSPQALVDGARHVMVLAPDVGAAAAAARARRCRAGASGAGKEAPQMIMRPGQQLLLPANPLFIWGSLLLALLVNMLPLGRTPWMPDLLALVLVFWSVHQPLRVGIGAAFVFGLAMDVHQAALLGQHALAYTALSYLRDHDPPPPAVVQRAVAGGAGAAAVRRGPRDRAGGPDAGRRHLSRAGRVLLAPVIEAVLWPVVSVHPAGAPAPGARSGRESAVVRPCNSTPRALRRLCPN